MLAITSGAADDSNGSMPEPSRSQIVDIRRGPMTDDRMMMPLTTAKTIVEMGTIQTEDELREMMKEAMNAAMETPLFDRRLTQKIFSFP